MADDKDLAKLMYLMEALIEGQKRSVGVLEVTQSKYDLIAGELTKLSRQGNRVEAELNQVGARLGAVETRLEKVDARLDRVDTRLDAFSERFDEVDARLDAFAERFDKVDLRMDGISARLGEIETQLDQTFTDFKALRVELTGQHNEVLNALQMGLGTRLDLQDLAQRLAIVERKLGL